MTSTARPPRPSTATARPGARGGIHPAALREAARKRLVSRILMGSGIATMVLLVALLIWRRVSLGSPAYALSSIREAFREHDGTRLAYYADLDAIAQQVANEGVDWLVVAHRHGTLAALRGEVRDIGTAPDSAQRVQLLKFALADHGGHGVGAALSAGTTDSANVAERMSDAFTALPPLDVMLGDDHLDFVAVGNARRVGQGRVIPVMLEYRELGAAVTVSLLLAHEKNRWKVVGFEDFDETLSALDDAQSERLTTLNQPLESRLEGMLVLGVPVTTLVPIGRHRTDVRLQVPVRNASPYPVRAMTVLLGERGGDEERAEILVTPLGVAPGATVVASWTFEETRRGAWLASRPDKVTLRPRSIEYDSAGRVDTLRLFRSYAEARRGRAGIHSAMDSTDSAP
jgi:hypothetical protein